MTEEETERMRRAFGIVRALPNVWRERARRVNQPDSPSIYVDCAEELEEVLGPYAEPR